MTPRPTASKQEIEIANNTVTRSGFFKLLRGCDYLADRPRVRQESFLRQPEPAGVTRSLKIHRVAVLAPAFDRSAPLPSFDLAPLIQ